MVYMAFALHSTLCACVVASLAYGGQAADCLSKTVRFPAPEIGTTPDDLTRVALPDCTPDFQTGRPILPLADVTFELPADSEIETVTLTPGSVREIPLDAPVEWGQIPYRSFEEPPPVAPADPQIYGGTQTYPRYDQPVWRVDPTRSGQRVSVQVPPVRLDPVRNVLLAADAVTVAVTFRQPSANVTKKQAALAAAHLASSPLAADGPYTYVVISTSNLISNTPGPWNLQALCAARARAGFTTKLVSTEWIQANYAGTNQAIRIRAFVQDAYKMWGVQHLLLAGTFDLLPVQKLSVNFVDLVLTRTAEIPADAIYYGCMTGTFDDNGNGRYGEPNDGPNGGDVDLTAEVMVGRFPVANATELSSMVRKTLRYESATAAELRPIAHIAERVDFGSTVYATGFMDELRNGSTAFGLTSLGFKNSSYAGTFDAERTLYDSDASIWTTSNAFAFLNQNLHCINHLGHGATKQCIKIALSQAASQTALAALTNTMPYFVYSQACDSGGFDTADCFAEQLVTVSNAAFSAVMNAREGWEYSDMIGGVSHRFHRCFWDAALRGNATRLGEINEYSRSKCLSLLSAYSANYWRWVYYELNLFGDPATPFAASVNTVAPTVTHEPLVNTYDTQTAYRVTCTVEPIGIFDPEAISLLWRTDREPDSLHTQAMTQVSGNLFEAFILPQQANTRVEYAIHALNHAGCETVSPGINSNDVFHVTDCLTLSIFGSPTGYGTPDPDYGTYSFASGIVATASAPDVVPTGDGTRVTNIGFFGTGSAPQSGTNLTVSFQMDTSSMLVWMWLHEYRLLVGADVAGQSTQTFWVAKDTAMAVPNAPEQIALTNGTVYAFAEWRRDGVRFPALPARSGPSLGSFAMDAPHALEAHYLLADLDADTNGIPDWWEIQYYGTHGKDPQSDDDGDGYTLAEEYRDRTDPLDASKAPAPPSIAFSPLAEIQTHPGPFEIRATVTDTHAVSSATVYWHRKTEAWQSTAMTALSNNLFVAQIGNISAPGDDFEYQIIAADPDGRTSQTDVYFLFLRYPLIDTSRFHDLALVALPTQSMASATAHLFNTGNGDLVWSTRLARVESITDPSLRSWNRASLGQSWEVSTNRFASPPYSLHCKLVSSGLQTGPAVRATITLPPLLLGANATLSFKHWIYSEVYLTTTRAFDGGIVEYSKDNGVTFQQLNGPYTHTLYGWDASPWTNDTPCFAGNGSAGWQTVTFDLAKYYPAENGFQGRPIIFRFHYGGDNNTDNEGWYIDDVTVAPLLSRSGFFSDIDPASDGTIAPGDYRSILWYNLPTAMDLRDDNLTVSILSNDPITPIFSFFWQIKIRDYPRLPDLAAQQSTDGDGRIRLTTGLADSDGEPIDLSVDWSKDSGKTWQPAALTNIFAATGTVALAAANGVLTHLSTASGTTLLTNRLSAVWESRLPVPAITVNTQMLFRISATNGYYGTSYTTARFTVDNVSPVFNAGSLAVSPLSCVGRYAVTTNELVFVWPSATDNPATNLTYRLERLAPQPAITGETALTTLKLALSNSLDSVHTFRVVARDPAGNVSDALSLSLPVLNARGDYDGDGMTTADEEIAGTSAVLASDRFAVGLHASTSNTLSLSWNGVLGRTYTVEATPTLLPPDWKPLTSCTDIPGTGVPLTLPLPSGANTQFFRLKVYQP